MSPARKPRKALDDTLAAGFVYGDGAAGGEDERLEATSTNVDEVNQVDEAIESEPVKSPPEQQRGSLMSRLMEAPEKEPTVRITVDLPKSMHHKLSMLSARTGKKKAEIVRMLLDDVLNDVQQ